MKLITVATFSFASLSSAKNAEKFLTEFQGEVCRETFRTRCYLFIGKVFGGSMFSSELFKCHPCDDASVHIRLTSFYPADSYLFKKKGCYKTDTRDVGKIDSRRNDRM